MHWNQANFLCKFSGKGRLTDVENDQDLQRVSSWIRNVSESCPLIWLPLSDERKEGVWQNTNSDSVAKYLRWSEGQPNGLRTQNHAALDVQNQHFLDFFDKDNHCAFCTLNTKASLNLRGLCMDSYLGELSCNNNSNKIPTLHFTDTLYMALNEGNQFKLSGSFYTDIRWDSQR